MPPALYFPVLPPDEMLWTARELAKHLRASISWVCKGTDERESLNLVVLPFAIDVSPGW